MKSLPHDSMRLLILAILLIVTFSVCLLIWGSWHDEWSGYNASIAVSNGTCNIAIIPMVGNFIPYAGADQDGSGNTPPPSTNPDDTLAALRAAEADPNIRGVLVRVDSSGGSPVAAEVIANGLKHASLPLAALIREVGASAAYLAATGAKTIIASPFSDIG